MQLRLQLVAYLQLGYVQALAPIGFATSWLLALAVAALVGWLARRIRKAR